MTVRTVLKVPLEKAAPLALLTFRHPWLPVINSLNTVFLFAKSTVDLVNKNFYKINIAESAVIA